MTKNTLFFWRPQIGLSILPGCYLSFQWSGAHQIICLGCKNRKFYKMLCNFLMCNEWNTLFNKFIYLVWHKCGTLFLTKNSIFKLDFTEHFIRYFLFFLLMSLEYLNILRTRFFSSNLNIKILKMSLKQSNILDEWMRRVLRAQNNC